MRLETLIVPRRDGSVSVTAPSGAVYTFTGTPLTCAVDDDKDIGFLLDTGNFYPSDEADIPAALTQASPPMAAPPAVEAAITKAAVAKPKTTASKAKK